MGDESELVHQDEVERLLGKSGGEATPPASAPPQPSQVGSDSLGQEEIESLLAGGKKPQQTAIGPAPNGGEAERLLGQGEIERLLSQAGKSAPAPAKQSVAQEKAASTPMAGEGSLAPHDIEVLLSQAERALASATEPAPGELPPSVSHFRLPDFSPSPSSTENATLDLIRDVELDLRIELGRTQMYLEDVLKLRRGSVVPLDKLAGDPVDIFVNGRLIARGEVLVLNDNFCVRVAELIAGVGAAT